MACGFLLANPSGHAGSHISMVGDRRIFWLVHGLVVQATVAVACRRAVHARSRSSVVAAASSAAPIAIKVICQPGMPPMAAAWMCDGVTVCSPFAHLGEQGKNRGSGPGGGVGVARAAGAPAARATATPVKSPVRT